MTALDPRSPQHRRARHRHHSFGLLAQPRFLPLSKSGGLAEGLNGFYYTLVVVGIHGIFLFLALGNHAGFGIAYLVRGILGG